MSSLSTTLLYQALFGFIASYVIWKFLASPLRHIPGPFLAKFTDLWRLKSALGRQPEISLRRLHDDLGSVVRTGPSMVSIAHPDLIGQVYSRKTILTKGDFYKVFDLNVNGHRVEIPFSTRSEQLNTEAFKPVGPLYSMSHVTKYEPLMDKIIRHFLDELRVRYGNPGKPCDIDVWLLYCAWDVIGEITWSKALGFLEHGKDVLNMISANRAAHEYISVVGQMPWLDNWLERNPIRRIGPPAAGDLVEFMTDRIQARLSGSDGHDASEPDMLDGFMEVGRTKDKLIGYLFANVAAGADTVAIELRAIVYYLCKHPQAMVKLRKELDEAQLSVPVPWKKCRELVYFEAVVTEACRLMPGVGLPLERRVGDAGMVVPGTQTYIPPGTTVGISPYVIHRDKDVFGADAEAFRPERWFRGEVESEADFVERLRRMKATDLTFGAGKRSCIGRNLALVEVYKVAVSLLCAFDIELVNPEKEWRTHNAWLMFQFDIEVRLRKR